MVICREMGARMDLLWCGLDFDLQKCHWKIQWLSLHHLLRLLHSGPLKLKLLGVVILFQCLTECSGAFLTTGHNRYITKQMLMANVVH